jgi:hypothetical protein
MPLDRINEDEREAKDRIDSERIEEHVKENLLRKVDALQKLNAEHQREIARLREESDKHTRLQRIIDAEDDREQLRAALAAVKAENEKLQKCNDGREKIIRSMSRRKDDLRADLQATNAARDAAEMRAEKAEAECERLRKLCGRAKHSVQGLASTYRRDSTQRAEQLALYEDLCKVDQTTPTKPEAGGGEIDDGRKCACGWPMVSAFWCPECGDTVSDDADDLSPDVKPSPSTSLAPEVAGLVEALEDIAHHEEYDGSFCADPEDCPNCTARKALSNFKKGTVG